MSVSYTNMAVALQNYSSIILPVFSSNCKFLIKQGSIPLKFPFVLSTVKMTTSGRSKRNVQFEESSQALTLSQPRKSGSASSTTTTSNKNFLNSFIKVESANPVDLAKSIFCHSLKSVIPSTLMTTSVQLQGKILKLANDGETTIDLSKFRNKYVVGFGKACLPMAESLLVLLKGHIDRCIVSVPEGFREQKVNEIEVHRGAHQNIPDDASYNAAKAIVELVQRCTSKDLLIVLISGGGSALLPYPIPPVNLHEKIELIKQLSKAGCTINELNTVRKRLSLVKGGGLVELANAGRIVSLIISDVAGNPLDVIASGPTVQSMDLPNDALKIIEKHITDDNEIPQSIKEVLKTPTSKRHEKKFNNVTNFIIGDNKIALEAASAAAASYGLHPFIVTTTMSGEASEVGYDIASVSEAIAYCMRNTEPDDADIKSYLQTITRTFKQNGWNSKELLEEIFNEADKPSKGICLLFGGETTVKVRGDGIGGRNQELALAAGVRLDLSRNLPHMKNLVAILSAGTDGIDGPNNAAGAVVSGSAIHNAQVQGYSPTEYLHDNNSYTFFDCVENGKWHVLCGHTETNVMDIVVVILLKKMKSEEQKSML